MAIVPENTPSEEETLLTAILWKRNPKIFIAAVRRGLRCRALEYPLGQIHHTTTLPAHVRKPKEKCSNNSQMQKNIPNPKKISQKSLGPNTSHRHSTRTCLETQRKFFKINPKTQKTSQIQKNIPNPKKYPKSKKIFQISLGPNTSHRHPTRSCSEIQRKFSTRRNTFMFKDDCTQCDPILFSHNYPKA